MIPREVKERYHEAQRLWLQQQPAETLAVLEEIERMLPEHPEVMLARAKCLLELDRIYEAKLLANRLFKRHGDRRGLQLTFHRPRRPLDAVSPEHSTPHAV